jgi:hypothetical protein
VVGIVRCSVLLGRSAGQGERMRKVAPVGECQTQRLGQIAYSRAVGTLQGQHFRSTFVATNWAEF